MAPAGGPVPGHLRKLLERRAVIAGVMAGFSKVAAWGFRWRNG